MKTLAILVLVVLFVILFIQNSQLASVKFYFWNIYAPQFILVFFVFLIGLLVGFLAARIEKKKDKKSVEKIPPPPVPKPQP
jgi:uncharacterized integral membrane protein